MDLSPYVASLREDLATAAAAGDEETRRAAAVLGAALEPAARLALMNALSDLAAEITAALDGPVVEIRLDRRDVKVVVSGAAGEAPPVEPEPEQAPPPPPQGEGDMSRMTLRLFEELKARAEQAASTQGVSLNTFVQQAVAGALHGMRKPGGEGSGSGWPGWGGTGSGSSGFGSSGSSSGGSRVKGWTEG